MKEKELNYYKEFTDFLTKYEDTEVQTQAVMVNGKNVPKINLVKG